MRKQNRECLDPEFFDEVFSTADDLCLAMHDGDFPYVIPLNFVRQGNSISASGNSASNSQVGGNCGSNGKQARPAASANIPVRMVFPSWG